MDGPTTSSPCVSTYPNSVMSAGPLSYWPSMAASFVGCCSATTTACQCEAGIINTQATSATIDPTRRAQFAKSALRPCTLCQHAMATRVNAPMIRSASRVCA